MANEPEPKKNEKTTWSPGLIGFYLSCTAVSLGAAIAAVGGFLFAGQPLATTLITIGVVMCLAGAVGALRFLKAARKELR